MRTESLLAKQGSTLVALALTVCIPSAASAGPAETFGFGSRSTALGGAVSADVRDSSANFYNPAGLVAAPGLSFDVGYVHAFHFLKTNGNDNHVDRLRALTVGFVAPGKVASLPFALGFAMHLPDDRIYRVRSLDQAQPRWEMYDNRTQRIYLSVNLAVRPLDWLEVGGGLGFMSSTHARLDITGTVDVAKPGSSTLRHEVDGDLIAIRYPQFGVRVTPTKRLRLAAVYREEFQVKLNIEARVDIKAQYFQLNVPLFAYLTTMSISGFSPRQAVIGGSYDVTDDVTIDADLTWVNWNRYESPATRVTSDVRLDPPQGFPTSLLPEKSAPTKVLDANFKNRVVPRVGVEGRIPLGRRDSGHQLALRAGYFFEKSPVDSQSGLTNFVDADRHAFSAGVGLRVRGVLAELPGDLSLDLHGMLSVLPERTFAKTSAADLVGDYRAEGKIWSIGSTLGVSF